MTRSLSEISSTHPERLFGVAKADLSPTLFNPLRKIIEPFRQRSIDGHVFLPKKRSARVIKPNGQTGEWRMILEEPVHKSGIALVAFSQDLKSARIVRHEGVDSTFLEYLYQLRNINQKEVVRIYNRVANKVEIGKLYKKFKSAIGSDSEAKFIHLGGDNWLQLALEPALIYINTTRNTEPVPGLMLNHIYPPTYNILFRCNINLPTVENFEIVQKLYLSPDNAAVELFSEPGKYELMRHSAFVQFSVFLANSFKLRSGKKKD